MLVDVHSLSSSLLGHLALFKAMQMAKTYAKAPPTKYATQTLDGWD